METLKTRFYSYKQHLLELKKISESKDELFFLIEKENKPNIVIGETYTALEHPHEFMYCEEALFYKYDEALNNKQLYLYFKNTLFKNKEVKVINVTLEAININTNILTWLIGVELVENPRERFQAVFKQRIFPELPIDYTLDTLFGFFMCSGIEHKNLNTTELLFSWNNSTNRLSLIQFDKEAIEPPIGDHLFLVKPDKNSWAKMMTSREKLIVEVTPQRYFGTETFFLTDVGNDMDLYDFCVYLNQKQHKIEDTPL